MRLKLMLDTNVLGQICHPRRHGDVRAWFYGMQVAAARHEFYLSEIADYELRRKLLHINSQRSLQMLDRLGRELSYLPIKTVDMREAAHLWARLRNIGKGTAGDKALDGDLILAAQALREGATVVSSNTKHLSLMVETLDWGQIQP